MTSKGKFQTETQISTQYTLELIDILRYPNTAFAVTWSFYLELVRKDVEGIERTH